ncbi:MAG: endolytic transglycosylase MltG [Deltaproteobacteria bacterium]|nr:endolytic transglycosylase MltG [Deltaproteobacteria bacterium]
MTARRFFAGALALAGLLVVVTGVAAHLLVGPTAPGEPVLVEIEPGTSFMQIAARLEDARLIRSRTGFLLVAKLRGQAARLRAGEFEIARGQSALAVLEHLVTSPVVQRRLTIPEGWTVRQIATAMIDQRVDDAPAVRAALADGAFARAMDVPADSFEGYLFPDTYQFTKGYGARRMIEAMVRRFFDVYGGEFRARERAAGLTTHQVVTLASIVEKETGAPAERPLVSRVFLNRLALGMPLQSDPTVIYGLGERYTGKLRRTDLSEATPYNTYRIPALPPGPIASPGRESLRAVLWPAESNALYFVSRNDGTHAFSATYAEHRVLVDRYQRSGAK